MKLNTKTRSTFFAILILSIVIGTLAWEIVERVSSLLGLAFDLSVGPVELDAFVVSVAFRPNPGTVLGIFPGIALFRRV